ncbi:MAG: hypothetical protein H5U02_10535 [Clostridia bacterium]|nr:hypothetical protein [Clostridia bacterium]
MFNRYRWQLGLAVLAALLAVTGVVVWVGKDRPEDRPAPVSAPQPKTVDEIMKLTGQFIRNHPNLLSDTYKQFQSDNIPANEVVAWVNGYPIGLTELEFVKGLGENSVGPKGYSHYFNRLVEEKLVMKEAAKRGLLPTEKEISAFIEEQKKQYAEDDPSQHTPQDPSMRYVVDMLIKEWNLTWDEYWNLYERYNVIRLLSLQKLNESILAEAEAAGKVPSVGTSPKAEEQRKTYLGQYKLNLKRKAKVKLNPQFQSLNLSVDKDRFYLSRYPF